MQLEGGLAVLSGTCGAEDAAEFADWLRAGGAAVRLDELVHMHSAMLQCLMAFRPGIEIAEADPFIRAALVRAGAAMAG